MDNAVTKYEVVNFEDYAMSAENLRKQVNLIQTVMQGVMKPGEHYGTIPGCGDKPTLLKPGAEKLSTTFRLAPSYQITKSEIAQGHREYEVVCTLTHITTGMVVGQGVGSCTTMEGKYRFRKAEQVCPECGETAIIKGKKEYGGGWLCFKKKGGCGAKFRDGDPQIENQEMGRIEHDNPADYYNTVLKMAKKRAHVDAVLTATAASDIFTQDVEDMPEVFGESNGQQKAERKASHPPPRQESSSSTGPKPLSPKQKQAIFKAGAKKELSEDEVRKLVRWKAEKEGIDPNTSAIADYFIGKDEGGNWKFDVTMEEYLDTMEQAQTAEQDEIPWE